MERLIRAVQGFVSFSLVRTASGGFSASVFQNKAGTDESVRVAREWIAKERYQSRSGPTGALRGDCHSACEVVSGPSIGEAIGNKCWPLPHGGAGAVAILVRAATPMRHRKDSVAVQPGSFI